MMCIKCGVGIGSLVIDTCGMPSYTRCENCERDCMMMKVYVAEHDLFSDTNGNSMKFGCALSNAPLGCSVDAELGSQTCVCEGDNCNIGMTYRVELTFPASFSHFILTLYLHIPPLSSQTIRVHLILLLRAPDQMSSGPAGSKRGQEALPAGSEPVQEM